MTRTPGSVFLGLTYLYDWHHALAYLHDWHHGQCVALTYLHKRHHTGNVFWGLTYGHHGQCVLGADVPA